jgi:hypothetical protein
LLGQDPYIIQDGNNFYLKSTIWDQIQEARQVHDQAERLIHNCWTSQLIFTLGIRRHLTIDHIQRVEDDGRKHHFRFTETGVYSVREIRIGTRRIVGDSHNIQTIQNTPEHEVVRLFRVSNQNLAVADALRFFRKGDWVSLYKAYEIVRENVRGDREIIDRGWLTEKTRKRFTQTAQSREALGDQARHASHKYKPPKQPLLVREAKAMIGSLLQKWIRSL